MDIKGIAVLGSTGSIGRQALEVIHGQSGAFELEMISAHSNAKMLIEQAIAFRPNVVVIGDRSLYPEVREALSAYPVKVYAGEESVVQALEMDTIDLVLVSIVGFAGLLPTIRALELGKPVALANKETLVVAGEYVTSLARRQHLRILPVDSEHSAIFQCLAGEEHLSVEKLILTASGGPFRETPPDQFSRITKKQALTHPNWNMGNKITIDSATLMNKGLEVIEARWLFDLHPSRIEVVIHPQSVIHSMVQFHDGSVKAQMGLPDMRLPILYALSYPYRFRSELPRLDFGDCPALTFERPDFRKFRNLTLAYEALKAGGNMPCILNAANEVAVEAFLGDRTGFAGIPGIIETCMQKVTFLSHPSLQDYFDTDRETRALAQNLLNK
jgi:1-deoxy-D-xylulose-5-phosphate reductoisomerase